MNHNHSGSDGIKHLILMVACCLLPIAAVLAVGAFGFSLVSLGGLLPYAMALLCPLMMIFMMRGMMGGQHSHEDYHLDQQKQFSPLRAKTATEPVAQESDPPHCH